MIYSTKSKTPIEILGATPTPQGVSFRVWAPAHKTIDVMIKGRKPFALKKDKDGFFAGFMPHLKADALYRYRINGQDDYPDPCSRFQPQGPHGPSMIINPENFKWHDDDWQSQGIEMKGQVMYELHVGAFSKEGTYAGVEAQLKELKDLGITVIEFMPLADFCGRWNWGYDGVNLFAPAHVYGTPDELRHLIDTAHQLGMGIILDVVYNHFGPDGNYVNCFSPYYFTKKYKNDWGESINFHGEQSHAVRQFFIQNAVYWIKDFHFDGFRLDATQNIYDTSHPHILADISKAARLAAGNKKIIIVAENESQDMRLVAPLEEKGFGLDGMWNDDFHHTAAVALSGRREAYYKDYLGKPQEFISLIKYGFLYQGQYYSWQGKNRGTRVLDKIDASTFISFLENHDQVANSLHGHRMTEKSDAGLVRALTALYLLSPQTPLIFMGQEFASSSPFLFFADHHLKLRVDIFKGRKEFLSQFPSILIQQDQILDPCDEAAFYQSKLNFKERTRNQTTYNLYKDLLKIRREDEVFNRQDRSIIDGDVLADLAFCLRYRTQISDRLMLINLGQDVELESLPFPLLAPLAHKPWKFFWSSEDIRYDGGGVVNAFHKRKLIIPANSLQIYKSGE